MILTKLSIFKDRKKAQGLESKRQEEMMVGAEI